MRLAEAKQLNEGMLKLYKLLDETKIKETFPDEVPAWTEHLHD